jgi:hypothetical protein
MNVSPVLVAGVLRAGWGHLPKNSLFTGPR